MISRALCPGCAARDSRAFTEKNGFAIVQCRRCATLFTSDAVQKPYDDGYASEIEAAPFLSKRLDEIVSSFGAPGRLLDVGFGAGDFLDAARRAGWNVSGVELASAAVERARRRGIDALRGTLFDAHYDAASFDVVIASELVEHVLDVEPLLAEIARVLRPGGFLWATTPHGRGLSARVLGPSWSVINPPQHIQLFSIKGLRALLRRAGFANVKIAAEGVNPHELLRRGIAPGARIESGQALNAYFEERRGRRAVKRAINRMLATLRLGDSLKIVARQ